MQGKQLDKLPNAHAGDIIACVKLRETQTGDTLGDKSAPIVCQCGGGFRSALVCENLQRMGYTNIWSLDGGYRGWVEKGLPIEHP